MKIKWMKVILAILLIYVPVGVIVITYNNYKALEIENKSLEQTIKDKDNIIKIERGLIELRDEAYQELYIKYQQEIKN